jgi:Mn-dependent DtxR family transcriptional regulator
MSQKGSTPDEKFLIKLYQTAMEGGDPFGEVDARGVAAALGQRETAVKNIVKHLAQANFIKKIDDTTLYLTKNGCDFVLEELERK